MTIVKILYEKESLVEKLNTMGIPEYVKLRYDVDNVTVYPAYGPAGMHPDDIKTANKEKWSCISSDSLSKGTFQLRKHALWGGKENQIIFDAIDAAVNRILIGYPAKNMSIFVYELGYYIVPAGTIVEIPDRLAPDGDFPKYVIEEDKYETFIRYAVMYETIR